jgi:hypothetical protein
VVRSFSDPDAGIRREFSFSMCVHAWYMSKKKVSQKKHNVKDSTNACMSWCFFFLLGAVALSVVGIQAMFSCQPTAMKFGTEARPDSPGSMRPTPNNWTAAGGLGAYFRRTWPIKEAGSPLCCILFTVYNREFISTS